MPDTLRRCASRGTVHMLLLAAVIAAQPLPAPGRVILAPGRVVPAPGRVVLAPGRVVPAPGRVVPASGLPLRAPDSRACATGAGIAVARETQRAVEPSYNGSAPDSLTRVLGPSYAAGGLRRFLLGSSWRAAWTASVTVPLVGLDTIDGGLVPERCGEGLHAHVLYLRTPDGRRFRFQTVNRDPAKAWRPDVRRAVVTRTMRDQIVSMLPFAPAAAAALDRSAGLPAPQPVLLAFDVHPLLTGAFARFAREPGLLEEEDAAWIDTYTMLQRTEPGPTEHPDAVLYCRARLMDVLLGDWSRSADQWRWHPRSDGVRVSWEPVPVDREQAFSLFDGLFPSVVEQLVRPLESFDDPDPDLAQLTWTARHLDRRLLGGLSHADWDSAAQLIRSRIDDATIDSALAHLPAAYATDVLPRLRSMLIARRERLPELAAAFYRRLAQVVDVRGTAGDDRITVRRRTDGALDVTVRAPGGERVYSRRFEPDETGEVRIDAGDGNDSVLVTGETEHSIDLRAIGGAGADALVDSSHVRGWFLRVTPIRRAEHCTWFYDDDSVSAVVLGPGATFDSRETLPPSTSADRYEPLVEDRGSALRFDPRFTYNSDDGFIIGGGPVFTRYGFRQDPFSWRAALSAAYATAAGTVLLQSDLLYNSIMPGVMLHLSVFHSEISQARFYGFGNRSVRDEAREAADFYLVRQELVDIRPALRFRSSSALTVEMGAAYRYSEVDADSGSYFAQQPRYGAGPLSYGEIFGLVTWDTRDSELLPMRGAYARLAGSYYPVILDNRDHFADGSIDLRAYLPLGTAASVALRGMAQHIWGRAPFFHAAYLGGKSTLRGFSRERFAGDAAVLANAELRLRCGGTRLLLPGEWGMTAFADAGRVFSAEDGAPLLHAGWGGGLWIAALERRLALSVQLARSSERLAAYVKTGFTF